MTGSFHNIDDLLQGGILECERIIITNQGTLDTYTNTNEEFMDDAYTIIGAQTIYR